MALLTHKVSSCTDNYSLFAKEKPLYGIPYLDRSRSSIPTDAGSFFGGALSLRDSAQDQDATIPCTIEPATTPASQIVESTSQSNSDDDLALPDFEDEEEEAEGKGDEKSRCNSIETFNSTVLDSNASFVTAKSVHVPAMVTTGAEEQQKNPYVFHRWMKTMFRKSPSQLSSDMASTRPGSMRSSMESYGTGQRSSGLVSAVNTASITLASFPMSGQPGNCHMASGNSLDADTIARMLDRKHALEELIATEEYYIRDLKSLRDVSPGN